MSNFNFDKVTKPAKNRLVLTEEERVKIIKDFGLDDLLEYRVNEEYLPELLNGSGKILKRLAILIPKMIYKISARGAKASAKWVIGQIRARHKEIKNDAQKESAARELFYALLMLMFGLGINLQDKYNENPVFPNSQIVNVDQNTITVSENGEETTITNNKQTIEVKKNNTLDKNTAENAINPEDQSPILVLEKGQTPPKYRASQEMLRAIADVEHYTSYIYDANTRKRVTSQKEMLNMKKDLTIGYGHKLTKAERKAWKFNKTMNKEEAFKLFQVDARAHEKSALEYLQKLPYYNKVVFSQGFIDGLVSIRFNSSTNLAFGGEFWNRMNNCRIDAQNKCIDKSDFDFTMKAVKSLYTNKKCSRGLRIRRLAEYNIMRQKGQINPALYNLRK